MEKRYEVQHDETAFRFFIKLEGTDAEAVLQYIRRDNVIDLHHTYVPVTYRGQGLAEKLAKQAFEFARKNSLTVIPSCPYIGMTYLKRHPEYMDLVEKI